ncbi:MAG: AGE family epimerase/isomerase [Brevundimonas sp.]
MTEQGAAALRDARDRFFRWLRDEAYPLWARAGIDHDGFGFFEKITTDAAPVRVPRRARVIGRQIYAFSKSGDFGWNGPVKGLVRHGLSALPRLLRREDGLVCTLVSDDGTPMGGRPDLYDQAFTLFGLAAALPLVDEPVSLTAAADRLRGAVIAALAHPLAGFEEASPRTLPLKANPHMHMLEAALAWVEVSAGGVTDPAPWNALADQIADLALARFIDPATGALHEFFDGDWNRMGGELAVVEPGHQFEWGWLLMRWGRMRGREDALETGKRLVHIGEDHGLDPARGVLFAELHPDLSLRDPVSRLWPQTERIKAWVLLAENAGGDAALKDAALGKAAEAVNALMRYFRADLPGSWFDRMTPDGALIEEPAPASSFYHIVCAAQVLKDHE